MGLTKASISGYPDLVWEMSQSFPILKQWEAPANTPFNNRSRLIGHAREYLASFNERVVRNIRVPQDRTQVGGLGGPSIKIPNTVAK